MTALPVETFAPDDWSDDEETRTHWHVTDLDKANWAMRKLAKAQGQIDANTALAKAEKARIDAWLEDANASPQRDVEFFATELKMWHRSVRDADEDRKTIPLLKGKLASRQGDPVVEVEDEDVFTTWAAEHHPDWLKVERTVLKSEVKKGVQYVNGKVRDANGEEVPALAYSEGEVSYRVEVAK